MAETRSQAPIKEMVAREATAVVRETVAEMWFRSRSRYADPERLETVDFPRFHGDKILDWLFQIEQFFLIERTPEELKVGIASIHFDDIAATLHQSIVQSMWWKHVRHDWCSYKLLLQVRYNKHVDDSIAKLKLLKETEGIEVYHARFESISTSVKLDEDYLVSLYLKGLRSDTQVNRDSELQAEVDNEEEGIEVEMKSIVLEDNLVHGAIMEEASTPQFQMMREHGHTSHLKLMSDKREHEAMFIAARTVHVRCLLGIMLGILESTAGHGQQVVSEQILMVNERLLQTSLVLQQAMRNKKLKFSKRWWFKYKLVEEGKKRLHIQLRYQCLLELQEWFNNWASSESLRKHKKIELFTNDWIVSGNCPQVQRLDVLKMNEVGFTKDGELHIAFKNRRKVNNSFLDKVVNQQLEWGDCAENLIEDVLQPTSSPKPDLIHNKKMVTEADSILDSTCVHQVLQHQIFLRRRIRSHKIQQRRKMGYAYSIREQNGKWKKLLCSRRLVIYKLGCKAKTIAEMSQYGDQLVKMEFAKVERMLEVTQNQTFDPGTRLELQETLRSTFQAELLQWC
ncbi:hypothetical protein ISN44_As08g033080 [Arabidopsis suecica]|uniref:Retrotransposon gag domain-containing protein n=1 Tax=Arabidopsis suecica TaxID=45249 RepID=A0A8T2BE74_ARASU|nr:hypothetical protein ISN44_As08g033080 [Arabidopsis suecica]